MDRMFRAHSIVLWLVVNRIEVARLGRALDRVRSNHLSDTYQEILEGRQSGSLIYSQ